MKKLTDPDLGYINTFLARLDPQGFKTFQDIARHLEGHPTVFKNEHRVLPYKIHGGAIQDILNAKHSGQLIRGIYEENRDHTMSSYHRGGGLWDATKALLYWTRDLAVNYYELGDLQKAWDWARGFKHKKNIPTALTNKVRLLKETENTPGSRKSMGGFKHVPQFDSEYGAVFVNKNTEEAVFVIRGTKPKTVTGIRKDLLYHDAKILFSGAPGKEQSLIDTAIKVQQKYGSKFDLSIEGYSLGGGFITDLFYGNQKGNKQLQTALEDYDSIVLVNPGGSFAKTDAVKAILKDRRTILLANRMDPLSLIYTSNSTDKNRVYYGDNTKTFWGAHALTNWFDEDSDVGGRDEDLFKPKKHKPSNIFGTTPVEYKPSKTTSEDHEL